MQSLFSKGATEVFDFLWVAATFVMTLITHLGIRDKRYRWVGYSFYVTLACLWLLFVFSARTLQLKLFTSLMLLSAVVVGIFVGRKRRARAAATDS